MSDSARDLTGRPVTETEARLLAAYEALESLLADDLDPAVAAGVREAVASLWQVVNDLALTDRRPLV